MEDRKVLRDGLKLTRPQGGWSDVLYNGERIGQLTDYGGGNWYGTKEWEGFRPFPVGAWTKTQAANILLNEYLEHSGKSASKIASPAECGLCGSRNNLVMPYDGDTGEQLTLAEYEALDDDENTPSVLCERCDGGMRAEVEQARRDSYPDRPKNPYAANKTASCERCSGTGEIIFKEYDPYDEEGDDPHEVIEQCPVCKGTGVDDYYPPHGEQQSQIDYLERDYTGMKQASTKTASNWSLDGEPITCGYVLTAAEEEELEQIQKVLPLMTKEQFMARKASKIATTFVPCTQCGLPLRLKGKAYVDSDDLEECPLGGPHTPNLKSAKTANAEICKCGEPIHKADGVWLDSTNRTKCPVAGHHELSIQGSNSNEALLAHLNSRPDISNSLSYGE